MMLAVFSLTIFGVVTTSKIAVDTSTCTPYAYVDATHSNLLKMQTTVPLESRLNPLLIIVPFIINFIGGYLMKWIGAPEVSRHLLTLINLGVISGYSFNLGICVLQESTVSNPQTGNTIYSPNQSQTNANMETPMLIEAVVIFCVMAGAILGMLHPIYKIYTLVDF